MKKPGFFVPVICLVGVIVTVFAVIRNMNQPAIGDITQTPQTDIIKPDPYGQPGDFNGKYILYKYPAHYKQVPAKLNGNNLEAEQYHSVDSTGKLVNIAVYPGTIGNESGVSYRRQHPELYTESDSQKWVEFAKKDGSEDTFFITHGNMLAVVSATAPYDNQSGDALYIASSMKWH